MEIQVKKQRSKVMKKLMSLLMGAVLLVAVQTVWADDAAKADGLSTPVAASTPAVKHKAKKAKKKPVAKAAQAVWVCPMGDYSGPKTADGKCPKCGMDLVEKK
jgi:rubrerythrin